MKITRELKDAVERGFPERKVYAEYRKGTWNTSRFIWIMTSIADDDDIHYEYYQDHVELHLEGKYLKPDHRRFRLDLLRQSPRGNHLEWLEWQGLPRGRCRLGRIPETPDQLVELFREIAAIFDPILKDVNARRPHASAGIPPFDRRSVLLDGGRDAEAVRLATCSLGDLFGVPLSIPEYQRNYCWEDEQIEALWGSLAMPGTPAGTPFHLGVVILQEADSGKYEIIDGQQRLVTLTLVAQALGYAGRLPLLDESFHSEASRRYIANAKLVIQRLSQTASDRGCLARMMTDLVFSTLLLKNGRLELAHTFFSNENSKGVPLSDYDLLKAHHLRFISDERQSEHMAMRWDDLTENGKEKLERTLARHLLRLRNWMRMRDFDPGRKWIVRDEYRAAPVIPDIPPFGERFQPFEPIQGGAHFFAYAGHFVDAFERFSGHSAVSALRRHLRNGSHGLYADVVETLLFGYYLKFGQDYLPESLYCIASVLAQHRYDVKSTEFQSVLRFAMNSKIALMSERASSPTFFLAECLAAVRTHGEDRELSNVQMDFRRHLLNLFFEIEPSFTDRTFIRDLHNAYV